MKIEVNIEAQLEEIWQRIGLDNDKIEEFYDDLNKRVQQLFRSFLKENVKKAQELAQEAEEAEEAVRLHIKQYNLNEPDEIDESLPLLIRIASAKERLKELEDETRAQQEEYTAALAELTECFDMLDIDDRGEFGEDAADFGWDKIDRMTEKVKQLRTEIEEKKPAMDDICDEINELRRNLGMEEADPPRCLSDQAFKDAEDERDELRQHLHDNKTEITKLIKEVRWLERVLKMRQSTPDSARVFSDANLAKLRDRLRTLEKQKDDHIPELVEAMKKELLALWEDLHIPVPTATDFPFVYNCQANKRTLVALESEVMRLENLKQQIEPMLDLIAAREEILSQQNKLQSMSIDSSRLTSRRGRAASMIIEEERIRKRYNVELPKIHAKLIPMLEEYEEMYGEPFIWDGEDLLQVVSEMHRKEEEAMSQSRMSRRSTASSRTSHRSPGMKKTTKGASQLSQRAPFQLQEFMM